MRKIQGKFMLSILFMKNITLTSKVMLNIRVCGNTLERNKKRKKKSSKIEWEKKHKNHKVITRRLDEEIRKECQSHA
jgi:hypothetical protein